MPEVFDPYHKWLGIPPKDQPANHYRLLGVDVFESDREVIDSAANQRMAYLQELATGPQVEASQKLLNEISSARRCLLNEETKSAYDEQLRAELPSEDTGSATVGLDFNAGKIEAPTATRKSSSNALMIQAGVAVAALIVIVAIMFSGGSGESASEETFAATISTGVVFDWPIRERTGAMVVIDGEKKSLADDRYLQFELEPGEHTAIVHRDGYGELMIDFRLLQGKVEQYRLDWERSMAK